MAETLWVRVRSWHILRTWTRMPGRALMHCGRAVDGAAPMATFPSDERTCETCLRLEAKRQEG